VGSTEGPAVRISRALLSPYDKTGLASLARGLVELGVELWATGGTRTSLETMHLPVRSAEELTGIAAWFGGRVKTLHPALLGGILAPPTDEGRRELADRKLLRFDLVVVNFYPFEQHVAEAPEAVDREEYVDIGGVTLVRAAAKNHAAVTVLTDPAEYAPLLAELARSGGSVSARTRARLARRALGRVAAYDAAIAQQMFPPEAGDDPFPETIVLERETLKLRYGENPHQRAAVFRPPGTFGPREMKVVKGEALSYTNLLDVDTALGLVAEFPGPAAAVVKHATPCGVAEATSVHEALSSAFATDPVARFGCAVALNRAFTAADVPALHGVFVDLLAAPTVEGPALAALAKRAKLKVIETRPPPIDVPRWEARTSFGRVLVQEADRRALVPGDFKPVTSHRATPEQLASLDFAWRVVRHTKSNAIVLARGSTTVGIGAGQPTRVKAVELACEVAGERARGAVLASDAFFPFSDGVEVAARAGVTAILQPGGSVRDPEVVAVAEKAGIAMYATGWRVFRH
jgi:phosphoribosylaminoimidazolecarboxamide formyltransferase / IMP cyclohydrolase